VFKAVTQKTKILRQKVQKSWESSSVIEVRDGVPTRVTTSVEVEIPLTETVAVVEESGVPALDEDGNQIYAKIPVMEELEEEEIVQVADGTRLGLRYSECHVLDGAYLRTLIVKQGALISDLKLRVQALESA
jgi:hypothetical protein